MSLDTGSKNMIATMNCAADLLIVAKVRSNTNATCLKAMNS